MLTGQRILIIEDEPLVALDIEAAVVEAGAEIAGVATNIQRAVTLARSGDITLAVIDLRLGDDSSRAAVEQLAARNIPFIFYTGMDDTPTAARWPAAPVATKPAAPDTLVRLLHAVLSNAGVGRP